jgi:lysine 2,3-aminomutase
VDKADAEDRGEALQRRYPYYDPIATLPEAGQAWWANRSR